MGIKIIATGSYLPTKKVTNDDLAKVMDTSHEWIYSRTGICHRHISADENTSQLAAKAVASACSHAGITPNELGFIIVATMSPDYNSPSTACLVQDLVGATKAFAFDVNAACSGFVYAFSLAEACMEMAQTDYGVIIGAEVMSKWMNWQDRSTAVLFGDGAGCVVVKRELANSNLFHKLYSDGSNASAIMVGYRPIKENFESVDTNISDCLTMDGRSVFNFATRTIPSCIMQTLQQAGKTTADIDYFLCHQANARMIEIIANKIQQPLEKFPTNVAHTGNTSAASIPILLDELVRSKQIRLDGSQTVLVVGFGGGLTWGVSIIQL